MHLRAYVCSVLKFCTYVCVRILLSMYKYLHVTLCRFSAKQALRHPYFAELREAEIRALKARHEQSVSGASSLRGTAMAASTAGRQQHFGRVGLHHIMHSHLLMMQCTPVVQWCLSCSILLFRDNSTGQTFQWCVCMLLHAYICSLCQQIQ